MAVTFDARGSIFLVTTNLPITRRALLRLRPPNNLFCLPPTTGVPCERRKDGSAVDLQPILLSTDRPLKSTPRRNSLPSSAVILLVCLQRSYLPVHLFIRCRPRVAVHSGRPAVPLYPPHPGHRQRLDNSELVLLLYHLVDTHLLAPSSARRIRRHAGHPPGLLCPPIALLFRMRHASPFCSTRLQVQRARKRRSTASQCVQVTYTEVHADTRLCGAQHPHRDHTPNPRRNPLHPLPRHALCPARHFETTLALLDREAYRIWLRVARHLYVHHSPLRSSRIEFVAREATQQLVSLPLSNFPPQRILRPSSAVPFTQVPPHLPTRHALPLPPPHLHHLPHSNLNRRDLDVQRLQRCTHELLDRRHRPPHGYALTV